MTRERDRSIGKYRGSQTWTNRKKRNPKTESGTMNSGKESRRMRPAENSKQPPRHSPEIQTSPNGRHRHTAKLAALHVCSMMNELVAIKQYMEGDTTDGRVKV